MPRRSARPPATSLMGLEPAKALANDLLAQSLAALESFGTRAARLRELAEFIVRRQR